MDKIRMRFSKTGRAIYISHLDTLHTIQRAFSRAGISIKHSEGFNPHPYTSILLPLSVGASSVCELMDFRVNEDVAFEAIPKMMNSALPEGITVECAYEPTRKAAELKWLAVDGVFEYDERDSGEMAARLNEFFSSDEIIITKRTKRGMGETNICDGISSLSFEKSGNAVAVKAVLSAQEPTTNPDLLAEALRQKAPELAPDFAKFTRTETYDAAMNIYR